MEMAESVPATEDVEKAASPTAASPPLSELGSDDDERSDSKTAFDTIERYMVAHNLETRGIRRVRPSERNASTKEQGFKQIGMLWFSINLAAQNVTLGMLGPVVFSLSFLDASLCAVFGMIVGCLPVAYIATFGPKSGSRSLVIARYAMGWWPAKLVVVLNIIVLLGYSLIDTVVAGQLLSAVSPHYSLSIVVGIVITALITWVITTFGISWLHLYEKYAWISQIIVFSILAGVAGPHFVFNTPTGGNSQTRIGDRLSFFSICLSAAITYGGGAADYFVYYPETASQLKTFIATMAGLTTSFAYTLILGIGLGSGVATNKAWGDAYNVSQGALIVEAFRPLGAFGSFCSVIVALGLIANIIPPTYVSGVDFQILGRFASRVPRVIWNTIGVVIYTVCAAAGRNHLAQIFTNFLALMGYWVAIWISIMLEEQFIFRRTRGYDWSAWNDKTKLPIGYAALVAFLIGWVGAILSMAQTWYIGPFAAMVGDYGADMGNYVGFAWAALIYPPLRYFELKKFGR